jgi:hemerythrin
MSDIEWKKNYEIGHKRIDFEHQIFVDLISKIDDAAKQGKDSEYLKRLLSELRAYTVFHFISEENIMYSINYPEYESHKQLHAELLETYSQKFTEIYLGEKTIEDFILFLKDWFVTHTLTVDKRIASFVKDKYI